MRRPLWPVAMLGAVLSLGALLGAFGTLYAQGVTGTGIERKVLLTRPVAANAGYEAIVAEGRVGIGVAGPRHTHSGDEFVVLLDGEVTVEMDDGPPLHIKAGEAMHVPPGKPHRPKSVGTVPARFISIWIVEKGKPFAVNVP